MLVWTKFKVYGYSLVHDFREMLVAGPLNGKQFILDETCVVELLFLMDQERMEWFLGTYGQNLQDFVKELQRASAEIDKK